MRPCRPLAADCDERHLTVTLADSRVLQAPLWWYPRLLAAMAEQRSRVELSPLGMHWPEIDEDISVASMLRGAKAPGATEPQPAWKDGTAAVEGQRQPGGN